MSNHHAVEHLLSARHVDLDDQAEVTERCREHAVSENKLRAMLDVFGPLSGTLAVYLTT